MFSRKILTPALAAPSPTASGFALPGPLANPKIAAGAAGGVFLITALALIAVAGDPRAGSPRVRVSLTQPSAEASFKASLAPAAPPADVLVLPGGALVQAPIAGLFQQTPGGPLPVIAADGRTPFQAYARPFKDNGKPRVALVIGGLGLNAKATRDAIEQLPADVTLSFVPYAEGLQGWIDLARANGHEVLLETPMEPVDYPQNDPGPYTLMAADPAPTTVKRLEWLLSRASGYAGLTNYLGGRFMASDQGMAAFTGALRQRGLAFIDDGQADGRGAGVPRASAERVIDSQLDGAAIGTELTALEDMARTKGRALGSGFAYPVTVEQVRAWALGLADRGLQLAPASAVVK
ncbi:MAG: divergent polysaccharide deacetylase family protein [Caulobacteraceae bacterium]